MTSKDAPGFGKPREAVHEDLSAQFGGLLSKTAREDPAPKAGARKQARTDADPSNEPAAHRKTVPVAKPLQGRSDKADHPVPVSLPVTLIERLSRYREDTGGSNPSIIFTAIESSYHRLADLIADRTVRLDGAADSAPALFTRAQPAVRRSPDQGPRKQLTIRITEHNKQILDDLQTELNAPNRSVLVETALDAFLP